MLGLSANVDNIEGKRFFPLLCSVWLLYRSNVNLYKVPLKCPIFLFKVMFSTFNMVEAIGALV